MPIIIYNITLLEFMTGSAQIIKGIEGIQFQISSLLKEIIQHSYLLFSLLTPSSSLILKLKLIIDKFNKLIC